MSTGPGRWQERAGRARGVVGDGRGHATQLLGLAATDAEALGPGDQRVPARAVRRALADAGRKAVEVTGLVVSAGATPIRPAPGRDALEHFARLALGAPGGHATRALASPVDVVHEACATASGAGGGHGLVVAVVSAPGMALALCLGAAGPPPAGQRRARERRNEPATRGMGPRPGE